MTRLWIGTSWKMTKTLAEAAAYVEELLALPVPPGVQPFLLPPHTALAAVRDRLPSGSPILLGAQNAHWGPEGARTGEISMRMARDAGAVLVEIGHSERREHFAETDETVAAKVAAAVRHDLIPLVCVGESAEVRRFGQAQRFVADQVRAALTSLSPSEVARVLVAYEPVWAIGQSGRTARPVEVASVVEAIRLAASAVGGATRLRGVLYGGGVDRATAAGLVAGSGVDGLFIGRAGWSAAGFVDLMASCAPATSTAGPARRWSLPSVTVRPARLLTN